MKQLSNIKFLDQFCNVHINSIERLNVCQEKIHQFVFLQKMGDCTWRVSVIRSVSAVNSISIAPNCQSE